MNNTKKRVIILAAIACLVFIAHPSCATKQSPLQQPHITDSRIKAALINLGKEAESIVISAARKRPDIMFICGLVVATAGSYILLKTIMSDIPKIIGSTAIIVTGAALVFFANKKDS